MSAVATATLLSVGCAGNDGVGDKPAPIPAMLAAPAAPAPVDPRWGVVASPQVASAPAPRVRGNYKIGNPYQIAGRWYVPKEDPTYDKVGTASWYGPGFHGRKTANGEVFDQRDLTAAHPTLPLPSLVEVTNLANGRRLIVRVNDRGPYAHDRIIDLSKRVAEELGFASLGTARVRVRYVRPAPLDPAQDVRGTNRLALDGRTGGGSSRLLGGLPKEGLRR